MEIGKVVPDYTFTDLRNYSGKQASIRDFRGKWLVIDVWGLSCSACIGAFAKMDGIADKFRDKVQLLMVGEHKGSQKSFSSEKNTKLLFEKYKKIFNLKFSVAFDSVFYDRWGITGMPAVFYIDPDGVLRGRSYEVSEEIIQGFLSGRPKKMEYAYASWEKHLEKKAVDNKRIDLHGLRETIDTSIVFRSMITKYRENVSSTAKIGTNLKSNDRLLEDHGRVYWMQYHMSLGAMYLLAKYGTEGVPLEMQDTVSRVPIYDFKNQDLLKSVKPNYLEATNYFDYSVVMPKTKGTVEQVRRQLRYDLDNYFGFHTSWEKLNTPVWKLIVVDKEKVAKIRAAQAGKVKEEYLTPLKEFGDTRLTSASGRDILGTVYNAIVRYIQKETGLKVYDLVLVDETGLDYKLDITFRASMHDLKGIKKSLNADGLDIVKGEKVMSTLVIRDFDPGTNLKVK